MADSSFPHPLPEGIGKEKFEPSGTESFVDATAALPENYGDNRLVIMTRDPYWFFAYWEITHERAEQIRAAHGQDSWDQATLILRVYDLGDTSQIHAAAAPFFDVPANKFARQDYVQVPNPAHAYAAELGLRWPDGKFVSLFRSNVIKQPAGRVSEQVDTQWMTVGMASEHQAWERMAKIAIGAGTSKGGSATGDTATMTSLRWEFLRSVFSGSVSSWRPQEPKP